MVEYGILMFLLLRAMQQTFARWFSETSILLLCLFIVVCFAVTDEIHQGFVPQRISSYGDIMADATGAITMGVIWFITWKRWINQKQPAAVSEKRGELPTS
jgi:VanZ family protein